MNTVTRNSMIFAAAVALAGFGCADAESDDGTGGTGGTPEARDSGAGGGAGGAGGAGTGGAGTGGAGTGGAGTGGAGTGGEAAGGSGGEAAGGSGGEAAGGTGGEAAGGAGGEAAGGAGGEAAGGAGGEAAGGAGGEAAGGAGGEAAGGAAAGGAGGEAAGGAGGEAAGGAGGEAAGGAGGEAAGGAGGMGAGGMGGAGGEPQIEPCGDYQEACCPGQRCDQGGCVAGRCAAFGGVYSLKDIDEAERLCVGNPLAGGGCACPEGFVDLFLDDYDYMTDEGSGFSQQIHVCNPPESVPGGDFDGAWTVRTDPENNGDCAELCTPNPASEMCGCNEGVALQSYEGAHFQRGPVDCGRTLDLCYGPDAEPFTFAGSYFFYTSDRRWCADIGPEQQCVPNPVTGDCSCPDGWIGQGIEMFVKNPNEGGDPFAYCLGTMTFCVRTPPPLEP